MAAAFLSVASRTSPFWLNVQMVRTSHVRYIAPAIHAFLFLGMWISLAGPNPGFADGLSGLDLVVLMIVDLPFSIVAFGYMFQGYGAIAVIAWGIAGTLWWTLLGLGIDALVRRSRRKPNEVLVEVLVGLAVAGLAGGAALLATLGAWDAWVSKEQGTAAVVLASLTALVSAVIVYALTFRSAMGTAPAAPID
jgi:hypothetical protein